MNNRMIFLAGVALLAAPSAAAPAPLQDRMAELCSVSNTDVEGQRLARACRADVRAAHAAAQRLAARPRPLRTAEATAPRPR